MNFVKNDNTNGTLKMVNTLIKIKNCNICMNIKQVKSHFHPPLINRPFSKTVFNKFLPFSQVPPEPF